jgi:hypothetical protein
MTAGPPSGTVTFVFTDVEGSTALWQDHTRAMAAALARHDEIVRGAIERHHGYVFSTAGDAFATAFASATDAVAAISAAQVRLSDEPWDDAVIRVRAGLHTGEAEERGGDYFGPGTPAIASPGRRQVTLRTASPCRRYVTSSIADAVARSGTVRAARRCLLETGCALGRSPTPTAEIGTRAGPPGARNRGA